MSTNLDLWINQSNITEEMMTTTNKLENHLLSLRDKHQKRMQSNLHTSYNTYHEKVIELINWSLKIYTANINTQQNEEGQEVIIDDILKEAIKKKTIVINKKISIQRGSIDVYTRRNSGLSSLCNLRYDGIFYQVFLLLYCKSLIYYQLVEYTLGDGNATYLLGKGHLAIVSHIKGGLGLIKQDYAYC